MEEEGVNMQLPPQLHYRLSIKSGEPLTPCRDRLPGNDFAFVVADISYLSPQSPILLAKSMKGIMHSAVITTSNCALGGFKPFAEYADFTSP
ncbi:hypothetical protein JG687_00017846 [Phytophthora cactorum]|uniref:Uncharacterized protein n=1 Tax=Phytophthora cactorum TaxID=29920 RepID=A0A8T1TN91_9STRA|nr:hypothetical protein JG687_00017846 [Phytophthora cactorum]